MSGGHALRAVTAPVLREPWIALLVLLSATAYGTYSVLNHLHFGTYAYDLGIFDQVMWHYSRFEIPETTVVGLPTALGDHFHPILLILTPLYWVWSDPKALLIAQGVLIASSIVPVYIWCRERVGRWPAHLLIGAYVMFWGVHSAVAFDFHEIAFAPVILAFMLLAADRKRWRAFAALLVAFLLVKENLAMLVAFLGVYLAMLGERRKGAAVALLGVVWFFATTKLAIPWFGGGREFRHFRYQQFGSDLPAALWYMVTHPWTVITVFFDQPAKAYTLGLIFLPFLGLVFLSPLAVLLVPLLAERMYSTNPFLWGTSAHYSLILAPILVMGAADGLARLPRLEAVRRRPRLRLLRAPRLALGAAAVILVLNVWAASAFPLRALLSPSFYSTWPEDRIAEQMVRFVPPDASVAAQSHFVPHLSQRKLVFQLGPGRPTAEYLVAHSGLWFQLRYPDLRYVDKRRMLLDLAASYGAVYFKDGWVVMRRVREGRAQAPQRRRKAERLAG
ncbi:MAG: DUF2079 domain-containing protein [Gemmatimonadales bacterium]|nr:DUF2079 domain-containing protein [Gemmatimonadales bacterium]